MRKVVCIFYILLVVTVQANSQNLVPNGDFEEYTELPFSSAEIRKAVGWSNANLEYQTSNSGTPDYLNLNGYTSELSIPPYSGFAQAGLFTYKTENSPVNKREYISTKLEKQTEYKQKYRLKFHLTSGTGMQTFDCNNFGFLLTTGEIFQTGYQLINAEPQVEILGIITSNYVWKEYSYVFTSNDTYDHLTIGNFRSDQITSVSNLTLWSYAYYFIDDIELFEMNYSICQGDSIELEHFSRDSAYAWAIADAPNVILSNKQKFTVSPMVNTTYLLYTDGDTIEFPVKVELPLKEPLNSVESYCYNKPILLNAGNTNASSFLWQDGSTASTFTAEEPGLYYVTLTNECGTRTDTVRVDTSCTTLFEMPNVFSPNGDGVNDFFQPLKAQQISNFSIYIFNRWGNQLAEISAVSSGWDGQRNNNPCPEGVYYWLANYNSPTGGQFSKKGFVQLIR